MLKKKTNNMKMVSLVRALKSIHWLKTRKAASRCNFFVLFKTFPTIIEFKIFLSNFHKTLKVLYKFLAAPIKKM